MKLNSSNATTSKLETLEPSQDIVTRNPNGFNENKLPYNSLLNDTKCEPENGAENESKNKYNNISNETRVDLISSVHLNGENMKLVAKRLGINYCTAKTICQTFRREGRMIKKPTMRRKMGSELEALAENSQKLHKHQSWSNFAKSTSLAKKVTQEQECEKEKLFRQLNEEFKTKKTKIDNFHDLRDGSNSDESKISSEPLRDYSVKIEKNGGDCTSGGLENPNKEKAEEANMIEDRPYKKINFGIRQNQGAGTVPHRELAKQPAVNKFFYQTAMNPNPISNYGTPVYWVSHPNYFAENVPVQTPQQYVILQPQTQLTPVIMNPLPTSIQPNYGRANYSVPLFNTAGKSITWQPQHYYSINHVNSKNK